MRRDRSFPALTAVRGIAALMVVTTHAAFNSGQILKGWSGAALARLDFGVTLFFVLSGFLLARPFLMALARGEEGPSVRHYLWKRALRVLPLYWVVVAVCLLLDPENSRATSDAWVKNMTLTQLYTPTLLPNSLTQMWSLCTEVAFYVLLPPLLLLVTTRRGGRGLDLGVTLTRLAAIAVLGVAWQSAAATIPGQQGHYAQWLPGYLPWFVVGMVFAAVSASLVVRPRDHLFERLARDATGCWIVGIALFAVACSPIAGPRTLLVPGAWEAGLKDLLYTFAGAFLLLPLMFGPEREGKVRTWLTAPVPTWLGEISYGIFCIHLFVLEMAFRAWGITGFTGHFVTLLSTTVVVTVALASASYYLFERPILRYKNLRWFVRREPPARPDLHPSPLPGARGRPT